MPKTLKVREILPGRIYQRGEFRKFDLLWKRAELGRLGVNSVVCLINIPDPDIRSLLGDNYHYLPIPDGKVAKTEKLFCCARKVGDLLEAEGAALIHCRAGRNRSSLFSALLLVRLLGLRGVDAVRYMREKHPNSLANDHFLRFLLNIEGYSKSLADYVFRKGIE